VLVLDDFIRGGQVHPVLGRVVVERQQLVHVVDDFGDRLGELRAVGELERGHRAAGMRTVFGVPDLRQGPLRPRVRGLRQRREDVGDLVKP
jgi:hypothetical protein